MLIPPLPLWGFVDQISVEMLVFYVSALKRGSDKIFSWFVLSKICPIIFFYLTSGRITTVEKIYDFIIFMCSL